MICPYCNRDAPYTWRRYWRSILSRVRCHACNRVFRLHARKQDRRLIELCVFATVGCPLVLIFLFDYSASLIWLSVVSYPLLIWMDKMKETRATPIAHDEKP